MRKIHIQFERGGEFTARLLEAEAPRNCQMIWELLPLEGSVRHGMFSGEGFFVKDKRFKVAVENPRVLGIAAGTLGLEPPIEGNDRFDPGIIFAYGSKFAFKTPYTPEGDPLLVFGQVEQNLAELGAVGRRIMEYGEEKASITRVEE